MSSTQPRTVIGGRIDGDVYVIVLDGNQEVETRDESVAQAAATSKRQGKALELELDPSPNGGRSVIREFRVVAMPVAKDAAPTNAVATRPAAAISTSAPPMPSGLIIDPEQLSQQLEAMQKHYNVLSPAIAVSQMAPGFGANLAVVRIDPAVTFEENDRREKTSGSGPDCYWSKTTHRDEHKRSLNKSGLQKIAQAMGIQWDHHACRRLDDGSQRNYWFWKYVGYVRTHDGQLQTVEGSRELDLRDGAAEAGTMGANQLKQQRAMGNQLCETKAMQRAIRTFVRQVYTVDELKKPFLIVRFSFTPDMNDPEIKKLVTQNAMAGIGALYPTPPANVLPALPPVEDEEDDEAPRDQRSLPAQKRDPFADEPAAADELPIGQARIASIAKVPGSSKRGPWMRYDVTLSNGEIVSTFTEALHKLIDEAHASKAAVQYTSEDNPGYNDKLATLSIVDKRQGNLPMGEEKGGKY